MTRTEVTTWTLGELELRRISDLSQKADAIGIEVQSGVLIRERAQSVIIWINLLDMLLINIWPYSVKKGTKTRQQVEKIEKHLELVKEGYRSMTDSQYNWIYLSTKKIKFDEKELTLIDALREVHKEVSIAKLDAGLSLPMTHQATKDDLMQAMVGGIPDG